MELGHHNKCKLFEKFLHVRLVCLPSLHGNDFLTILLKGNTILCSIKKMATSIQELFTTAKVAENGCTITQVAPDFYRICTPVPKEAFPPYGFTFCSFLVNDEHPLLVHTGMKQLFPGVKAAVERVIPIEKLRYIFSSHHEGDEDGSLLQWLEAAPKATLVAHTFGQVRERFSLRSWISLLPTNNASLDSSLD